ncbi:hypothetical protein [Ideonella azotifigens]|uniref:hypothetical protein n=1 Tax=Ideonella azotifigens TaxID=513160 RepID=UPI001F2A608C|nr:hypothetical protein [Ideonella azotifigens]
MVKPNQVASNELQRITCVVSVGLECESSNRLLAKSAARFGGQSNIARIRHQGLVANMRGILPPS